MIGKTNIPMGMSKGETVSILLKTNQSSNEDLNGVKVVVSYDDESHEYSYNGQFSVEIPKDKTYTVTFGEVDGYKTPSSVTYTAVKGFSRNIEVTYYSERVIVNVSSEDGTDVDDKNVTVEKQANISVSNGVYILDTDGKYWNTDDWDDSATANCIAVITDEYKFGISASRVGDYLPLYSDLSITLSDLPMYTTNDKALADYDGRANTEILKKYWDVSDTSTAFGIICNYSFPDGRKAYIGSAGEWDIVADNYTLIKAASDKIGGNINNITFVWTSTAYNSQSFYYCRADGSYFTKNEINDQGSAYQNTTHAFCSLTTIEKHTIQNGKASFSVLYDETYTVSLSDMDGYTTPESQTYTASQPTREISMEYKKAVEHVIVNVSSDDNTNMDGYKVYVRPNVPNGVYIQDVDGNLYTESEWDTMKVANGIAVVTDECSFVVALEYARNDVQWSEYGNARSLTKATTTEAALDFNGLGNTNNMISTASSTNNAAQYCRDYIFPNGQTGYLGAAGEWNAVAQFSDKIEELISIIGGESIEGYIWTSTESDINGLVYAFYAWDNQIIAYSRASEVDIRAFAELGSSYTITDGKVEFDIPAGVEYTISVEDVDGYTTPEPQSFVAESGTRTVNMVYKEVKLGVFIQGVSGKLYETDAWTSQETPNGIAVITEECSFVIALGNASSMMKIHSSRGGALENYMTAISDETQAKADYYGATNTTNIMKLQSGTSYAAGWCNAFSFPSGKKGFLPSLGQMWAARSNKTAVNEAITKAGGTAFVTSEVYWTSTFWGVSTTTRYNWSFGWNSGTANKGMLSSSYLVRAFSYL